MEAIRKLSKTNKKVKSGGRGLMRMTIIGQLPFYHLEEAQWFSG